MKNPQINSLKHLLIAHQYWQKLVQPGDLVMDATCGNGHDSEFLYNLLQREGKLFAVDIQAVALEKTYTRLTQAYGIEQVERLVTFIHSSHEVFPVELTPQSITLIVYNLGYLPHGDKNLTTHASSTLKSLSSALNLIKVGGMISIMCYPGHPAGKIEQIEILNWATSLSSSAWICCHHQWLNQPTSPSLLVLQKRI